VKLIIPLTLCWALCVAFIAILVMAGCSEDAPLPPTGTDGTIAIITVYTKDGKTLRVYRADVREEQVDFSDHLCMFTNADTTQDVTVNTDQCTVVVDYLPKGVTGK
jgi:hypothetical protein